LVEREDGGAAIGCFGRDWVLRIYPLLGVVGGGGGEKETSQNKVSKDLRGGKRLFCFLKKVGNTKGGAVETT